MPRPKRSRWLDRIIGVVLGVALGLAVVIGFVFLGSEGTIDAPRISGVNSGKPGTRGGARLQLVRVINGLPPPAGPARLEFKLHRRARFVVASNQSIRIEIRGYGVVRTVGPGRSTVAFKATKPGLFPVIVTPSTFDIATVRVSRR